MVYENELIKPEELKEGGIYRKELLDFYAMDNKCALVIPDSPANIFVSDAASDYKVKQIIKDCSISIDYNNSLNNFNVKKIIIIQKA